VGSSDSDRNGNNARLARRVLLSCALFHLYYKQAIYISLLHFCKTYSLY
jgi:hypothetical protein